MTATAPAAKEATGPLTPVTFAASAYDAVDGNRPVTCTTAGGTVFASGDSFPVGTTTLTCSATDKAGNTGTSGPFDVTVTDTTAPVVTTSANLVVGNDDATVTYADATATDLVDGTVATTCSPDSGSTFALGDHDGHLHGHRQGRQQGHRHASRSRCRTTPSRSSPCPRTRQWRPPDLTVPRSSTVCVTAIDDVDGAVGVTCDKASGTVFPLGDTPVTCSASDKAGNTGQQQLHHHGRGQHPTVGDRARRHHRGSHLGRRSGGHVRAPPRSDVVDGDVASTCEPASGTTFSLGTTTVTCSATDSADNTGSANFTVTVRDTTAPGRRRSPPSMTSRPPDPTVPR